MHSDVEIRDMRVTPLIEQDIIWLQVPVIHQSFSSTVVE
jgi:hypothetical protein